MNQLTKHASDSLKNVRGTDIPRLPDMDLFDRVESIVTLIVAIASWAALIVFLVAIS